jgi:hypothetical protein
MIDNLSVRILFEAFEMSGENRMVKMKKAEPFFKEYEIKLKRSTYYFGKYSDLKEVLYYCVKNDKMVRREDLSSISEMLIEAFRKMQSEYEKELEANQ